MLETRELLLKLAAALALLWLPWPAESQQTGTPGTHSARNSATAFEAEPVRQVIRAVIARVDARQWDSLRANFAR